MQNCYFSKIYLYLYAVVLFVLKSVVYLVVWFSFVWFVCFHYFCVFWGCCILELIVERRSIIENGKTDAISPKRKWICYWSAHELFGFFGGFCLGFF